MFVGTNNVVRIAALKQIGGLYDSITEDMATGFELHRHRNPTTGRHWRSVYTPDVLAVGEGPASWTDFFTQQLRWSRGTYETLFKQYWKAPFTMPPGRLFTYTLMLVYYPMTAVNWLLGILSCFLFLWFGRLRDTGRRLRVADALQRRRRPPDRAVPVEPAAQRLARTNPRAPAASPAWRCPRCPRRST